MGGWSVMVMILCVYKWSQILVSVCVQVRLNVYKWSLCTSDPFLCVQVIPLPFETFPRPMSPWFLKLRMVKWPWKNSTKPCVIMVWICPRWGPTDEKTGKHRATAHDRNKKIPPFCIWVFPKMVVPPKHPKMVIFSRKTNSCWVPPF